MMEFNPAVIAFVEKYLNQYQDAVYEGCNEAEIAEVMASQGVSRLPELFQAILAYRGKKLTTIWQRPGEEELRIYPEILPYKKWVLDHLTASQSNFKLPDDAFIIDFWQGQSDGSKWGCRYFQTQQGHPVDPDIYILNSNEFIPKLLSRPLGGQIWIGRKGTYRLPYTTFNTLAASYVLHCLYSGEYGDGVMYRYYRNWLRLISNMRGEPNAV